MINLSDILPIFKKHSLMFKERYREVGDIYTFIFVPEEKLHWKAGQHGVFTINHIKIKSPTRPFSIASIPSEGHIVISMKISETPSAFKRALLDMKPGMKLSMRGPIGSFYPTTQKPALFIAGGIGITPYRALVKNSLVNPLKPVKDVRLLYLSSQSEFLYESDFENASVLSSLKTHYLVNREELTREVERFIAEYSNEAEYFIVGPKPMIRSTEGLLKGKGIKKKTIKKDVFIGY